MMNNWNPQDWCSYFIAAIKVLGTYPIFQLSLTTYKSIIESFLESRQWHSDQYSYLKKCHPFQIHYKAQEFDKNLCISWHHSEFLYLIWSIVALLDAGLLWLWGANKFGQLGLDNASCSFSSRPFLLSSTTDLR